MAGIRATNGKKEALAVTLWTMARTASHEVGHVGAAAHVPNRGALENRMRRRNKEKEMGS